MCISMRFNYDSGCFGTWPNLFKTRSVSSKDSLSSGWSKRMAALKLSRVSMYVPGSNGLWGFLGALCGCDPQIWIFWLLLKADKTFHARYIKFPEQLWHTQVLLRFLHAAPDSLHLAVGSIWTVISWSARLPMIGPCTVRPNGPAVVDSSASPRFAGIISSLGCWPDWLPLCWEYLNICLHNSLSAFAIIFNSL